MTTFLLIYCIVLTLVLIYLAFALLTLKSDVVCLEHHLQYHVNNEHELFKKEILKCAKDDRIPKGKYDEEFKAKVKADIIAGLSVNELVLKYGINKCTVANWRKEIKVPEV